MLNYIPKKKTQVGGRTMSIKINDNYFDQGGQWIMPEHKELIQVI